jgi:hypothetical protein
MAEQKVTGTFNNPFLFNFREYREAGNGEIKFQVKYPDPNHRTNGGTKKYEE